MKTTKQINLIGIEVCGISTISLWGGGAGQTDMYKTFLPLKFATKDNILRCVNDGGFGCEAITEAEIDIYSVWDNGSKEFERTLFADARPHRNLFLGWRYLREIGAIK